MFCRAVEWGPKTQQENDTFYSNLKFKFTPASPAGNPYKAQLYWLIGVLNQPCQMLPSGACGVPFNASLFIQMQGPNTNCFI